jgi:hypothetical protein
LGADEFPALSVHFKAGFSSLLSPGIARSMIVGRRDTHVLPSSHPTTSLKERVGPPSRSASALILVRARRRSRAPLRTLLQCRSRRPMRSRWSSRCRASSSAVCMPYLAGLSLRSRWTGPRCAHQAAGRRRADERRCSRQQRCATSGLHHRYERRAEGPARRDAGSSPPTSPQQCRYSLSRMCVQNSLAALNRLVADVRTPRECKRCCLRSSIGRFLHRIKVCRRYAPAVLNPTLSLQKLV